MTVPEDPREDCTLYVRQAAGAREIPVAARPRNRAVALLAAAVRSAHPVPDLRPFYVAVYDSVDAYPVAVYRNGEELSGAALEAAYSAPSGPSGLECERQEALARGAGDSAQFTAWSGDR
jgi:hypothetical protein